MPPRIIEGMERGQVVFVGSRDLVGMFTCFARLVLQMSEEGLVYRLPFPCALG